MAHEYELKYLGIDKDALRKTLKKSGYKLQVPERLMKRLTLYYPKGHPQRQSHWGRVRDEGDKITASHKWYENEKAPTVDTTHEEYRQVSTWEEGLSWVKSQGFTDPIYMENKREEWKKPGVEVCLDSWPGLKPFAEVEGVDEPAVLKAAKELGFNPQDGIPGGVSEVCAIELCLTGEEVACLSNMTFENPPKKKLSKV